MSPRGRVIVALLGALAARPAAADDTLAPLLEDAAAVIRARRVQGAAIAIITREGGLVAGGAGVADGRPMDGDVLFRVGSFSKSFVSLAVMKLVDEGKLRLEDRVLAVAPEIAIENRWERTHPLQVAHLLEHTAGFDEMRFNEIYVDREDLPVRELLAVNPRSRICRWPPGTRFAYAQPGYTVAAYLVEKVSGLPFERFMEERIFRPLGIDVAGFRQSPAVKARLGQGYERGVPVTYRPLLHRPAAGLMISARGVGRLVAMMLNRGTLDGVRVLSPESVARIERSGTLPHGPPLAAYGLGNWGDVSHAIPMRGHGGWMPGYTATYRYSPEHGIGSVVLLNDSAPSGAMRALNDLVMDHLLGDRELAPPPRARRPALPPERYAGYYELSGPTVEFMRFHSDLYGGVEVTAHEDHLYVRWLKRDARARLVPTGGHQFRLPGESASSIEFLMDTGRPRALVMHSNLFTRASHSWWMARRWGLDLSLLLLLTTAIVPPWLLLRRSRTDAQLLLPPFFAALALLATWTGFEAAREAHSLGTFNFATGVVFAGSGLFALLAHVALHRAALGWRGTETPRVVRGYALLIGAAATAIAVYMGHYGLVGIRTWAW